MVLTVVMTFYLLSCDDAEYDLNNPFDPENMDLDPPALFFHPFEISADLGSPISVELYALELLPAAAAHLDVRYDWGSVSLDSVVPGPFFTGNNEPIEVTVDEQGILDIFIYYLFQICKPIRAMEGHYRLLQYIFQQFPKENLSYYLVPTQSSEISIMKT